MKSGARNIGAPPPSFSGRAPAAPTILVVDDDPGMRTLLMQLLHKNGFHVLAAADHVEMQDHLDRSDIDLVLLDVMLPGRSGFDLCRDLRLSTHRGLPLIMISARGDEADRVAGLELGADDYIAKPFGQSELLARVRAALRRAQISDAGAAAPATDGRRFAGWTVNLRRREVFAPSGAIIDLSGAEYDLLISLLDNPQQVIGRERLLELSRARLAGSSDRSIDVLVSRLRRKLCGDDTIELIRTVRGVGYMFVVAVERF